MMPDQIMFEGFGQAKEPVRAEGLFYCCTKRRFLLQKLPVSCIVARSAGIVFHARNPEEQQTIRTP